MPIIMRAQFRIAVADDGTLTVSPTGAPIEVPVAPETIQAIIDIAAERQAQWILGHAPRARLTRAQVADALGINACTVTRAGEVPLATPRGRLRVEELFETAGREDTSASVIKERLAALIASEDPTYRPRSDERLRAVLAAEGIEVSRRAVTKYRLALQIEPSHGRDRTVP